MPPGIDVDMLSASGASGDGKWTMQQEMTDRPLASKHAAYVGGGGINNLPPVWLFAARRKKEEASHRAFLCEKAVSCFLSSLYRVTK